MTVCEVHGCDRAQRPGYPLCEACLSRVDEYRRHAFMRIRTRLMNTPGNDRVRDDYLRQWGLLVEVAERGGGAA